MRPHGVLHALLLVTASIATASVAACGGERPVGSSQPDPAPLVCTLGPSPAIATEAECLAQVRRLNGALKVALGSVLPADTVLSNNLLLMSRPDLELGVTFFPRRDESGEATYEALIRARTGGKAGNLDVAVSRYADIPSADNCPDAARLKEMEEKGMTQPRCDRHTVDGATVLVHDSTEPNGTQAALHNLMVTAYRADGMRVRVMHQPVIETAGGDPDTILTLEQLEKLALDPSLTL